MSPDDLPVTSSARADATTSASTPRRRSKPRAPAGSASTASACPTRNRFARAASPSTSGRQRVDRPAAGFAAGPQGDPRQPRHGDDRERPPVAYDHLDDDGTPTRIRLNSTVARVAVEGTAGRPPREGRLPARRQHARGARRERGAGVLQRADDHVALLPELPTEQRDALAYAVKVPMLYTNVLLRRWTSFKQLRRGQHQRAPACTTPTPASSRARPWAATRA